jgi:hypothetical protein
MPRILRSGTTPTGVWLYFYRETERLGVIPLVRRVGYGEKCMPKSPRTCARLVPASRSAFG